MRFFENTRKPQGFGVYLDDTSSLKIGGKAIVTAKAANDDAWGLNIVGSSESVFADDTAIGVEAGGIGYGVYAATDSTITFGESPLTRAVGEEIVTQVTVQSAGGKAYGIYSNDGSVNAGGQLVVDTKSNGYGAYGIYGANTGSVSVSEQAFIAAASENANAYGVLRGGGDTKFLMVADILFLWIVSIPLGALAGLYWHLSAFWKADFYNRAFFFADAHRFLPGPDNLQSGFSDFVP